MRDSAEQRSEKETETWELLRSGEYISPDKLNFSFLQTVISQEVKREVRERAVLLCIRYFPMNLGYGGLRTYTYDLSRVVQEKAMLALMRCYPTRLTLSDLLEFLAFDAKEVRREAVHLLDQLKGNKLDYQTLIHELRTAKSFASEMIYHLLNKLTVDSVDLSVLKVLGKDGDSKVRNGARVLSLKFFPHDLDCVTLVTYLDSERIAVVTRAKELLSSISVDLVDKDALSMLLRHKSAPVRNGARFMLLKLFPKKLCTRTLFRFLLTFDTQVCKLAFHALLGRFKQTAGFA